MSYWRCMLCCPPLGRDFTGIVPECPHCHAGPPAVLPVTLVHWLYRDAEGPLVGQYGWRWRLACQPRQASLIEPASDQPIAVTCPACRAHPRFAAELAAWGAPPGAGGLRIDGDCC